MNRVKTKKNIENKKKIIVDKKVNTINRKENKKEK